MLKTIKSYATKPSTYVIAVGAAILAFAFSRFLSPLKTLANKIPGSDAKTGA